MSVLCWEQPLVERRNIQWPQSEAGNPETTSSLVQRLNLKRSRVFSRSENEKWVLIMSRCYLKSVWLLLVERA